MFPIGPCLLHLDTGQVLENAQPANFWLIWTWRSVYEITEAKDGLSIKLCCQGHFTLGDQCQSKGSFCFIGIVSVCKEWHYYFTPRVCKYCMLTTSVPLLSHWLGFIPDKRTRVIYAHLYFHRYVHSTLWGCHLIFFFMDAATCATRQDISWLTVPFDKMKQPRYVKFWRSSTGSLSICKREGLCCPTILTLILSRAHFSCYFVNCFKDGLSI